MTLKPTSKSSGTVILPSVQGFLKKAVKKNETIEEAKRKEREARGMGNEGQLEKISALPKRVEIVSVVDAEMGMKRALENGSSVEGGR